MFVLRGGQIGRRDTTNNIVMKGKYLVLLLMGAFLGSACGDGPFSSDHEDLAHEESNVLVGEIVTSSDEESSFSVKQDREFRLLGTDEIEISNNQAKNPDDVIGSINVAGRQVQTQFLDEELVYQLADTQLDLLGAFQNAMEESTSRVKKSSSQKSQNWRERLLSNKEMVRELADGNLEVTKRESGADGSTRKMIMILDKNTRLPNAYKLYIDDQIHAELDLASSSGNQVRASFLHQDEELLSRVEASINPKQ